MCDGLAPCIHHLLVGVKSNQVRRFVRCICNPTTQFCLQGPAGDTAQVRVFGSLLDVPEVRMVGEGGEVSKRRGFTSRFARFRGRLSPPRQEELLVNLRVYHVVWHVHFTAFFENLTQGFIILTPECADQMTLVGLQRDRTRRVRLCSERPMNTHTRPHTYVRTHYRSCTLVAYFFDWLPCTKVLLPLKQAARTPASFVSCIPTACM